MNNIPWITDENLTDEQLYDREDAVDLLYNMLNSSQYGSTPSILLTGVRGVGKTVLLKKIQKMFEEDFLVIYINLRSTDAYQDTLDRLSIMKLIYKSIIQAASNKKLRIKNEDFPISFITSQTDYPSFADFVM